MTIDLIPVSIGDIAEDWDPEHVGRLSGAFGCKRDLGLERFLMHDAMPFHKKHRPRTYLFLSADSKNVLAYVTLGIKSLKVPKENKLTNRVKKEMDIYKGVSQSYLIGQLGKPDGVEKGIRPEPIELALDVFERSFRAVGCRTVRLDCKRELVGFYEDNGFKMVSQEEGGGELRHMVFLF
ncbi:MAG: hypothetical protein FWH47_07825 [Methanomassiliicoccaceae archaeon]|nr:hypothetical protein [Methanomassiliicoccaceae archaeon]